jgi:hypothetical protein
VRADRHVRAGRAGAALAVALAWIAMAAPAAGAVTFGANLARTPNSAFDCTVLVSPNAFGLPIGLPSGQRTCTWFSTGRSYRSAREGTAVPVGRGTINRARVRVGPVTGPMRFVVLEVLRNRADTICCKQVAATPVFVPRRNAVTTLRTNFPVRNSGIIDIRTGYAYYNVLALSVLAPNVPVPLNNTGIYGALSGPVSVAMYPALRNREERAGGAGVIGFMTLINGNWVRR